MKQNKIPRNEYIRKPVGKTNPYKHDVLYTNLGQWKYPGQVTRIPSNDITMQGVPYPVYGEDDLGYGQMMYPGMDYTFPGQYVTEYPQHKVFETEEDFNKDRLLQIRSKYWPTKNTRPFDTGFDVPITRSGPGPVRMPSVTSDYQGIAMMYGGIPMAQAGIQTESKKIDPIKKYEELLKRDAEIYKKIEEAENTTIFDKIYTGIKNKAKSDYETIKEAGEYVKGLFGGLERKWESMQEEDPRSIAPVIKQDTHKVTTPKTLPSKKTAKTETKQPDISFGYKELYTVPDVNRPKDSLVAFTNTFDNDQGARYMIGHKAKEVTDAGAQKTFNNAKAVAHFLRDSDILPGQKITPKEWTVAKGYKYKTTSPGKTVSAQGFDDPEKFRTLYKPNPANDGTYLVKYLKNKELTPEKSKDYSKEGWELDFTVSNQHKFSDIAWDKEGTSTGYAAKSKWVPLKNGKHTYIPYKNKDGFSRFSGGSVIYLFKDPKSGKSIGVDVSGSVNTIKKAGEDIIKKYGIKPQDLELAYHDMGSYSAKPKAHGDKLDYNQWLDYNQYNRGFSGAPLIIPKQKYGGIPIAQKGYNIVPNVEYVKGMGSQYDPILETVYIDSEDPEDPEKLLQHEMWHHYQNYNNYLRLPEDFPTRKRPQTPSTDEVFQEYYNRKKDDVEQISRGFRERYPEFKFVPNHVLYDRAINGIQYDQPWAMEGEGRAAESPEGIEFLRDQGYDIDQYREMLEKAKNKKAYGGDPSLPNITGHYETGGWLDQYAEGGDDSAKKNPAPKTKRNFKIVDDPNDPAYKDFLIRKGLYEHSTIPNIHLRRSSFWRLNTQKPFDMADFKEDYDVDRIKRNKSYTDESYGPHGSKVNQRNYTPEEFNRLLKAQAVSESEYNKELVEKYPPASYQFLETYKHYPYDTYYAANKDRTKYTKPTTRVIEDKIDRKVLKEVYPELTDKDINNYLKTVNQSPDFITNVRDANGSREYLYNFEKRYTDADRPPETYTKDGIVGYLPEEVQADITKDKYYLPVYNKPEDEYFLRKSNIDYLEPGKAELQDMNVEDAPFNLNFKKPIDYAKRQWDFSGANRAMRYYDKSGKLLYSDIPYGSSTSKEYPPQVQRFYESDYEREKTPMNIPYAEWEKMLQNKKLGGWLDEYKRGGLYTPPKIKRKAKKYGTSKNIQSSINKLFTRNYDVFGPGGKNIYNPKAYKTGGWLDFVD